MEFRLVCLIGQRVRSLLFISPSRILETGTKMALCGSSFHWNSIDTQLRQRYTSHPLRMFGCRTIQSINMLKRWTTEYCLLRLLLQETIQEFRRNLEFSQ